MAKGVEVLEAAEVFFGAGGLIAIIWSARLPFSSKYGALVTALSHVGL